MVTSCAGWPATNQCGTLALRLRCCAACVAGACEARRGPRVQLPTPQRQSSKSRIAASPGGCVSSRESQVQGIRPRSSLSCRAIAASRACALSRRPLGFSGAACSCAVNSKLFGPRHKEEAMGASSVQTTRLFRGPWPDLHERPKRPEWYTWPAHSTQHGCTAAVVEHWRNWPPERVQVAPQDQVPALAGCLDTVTSPRHIRSVLSGAMCPQAAHRHPRPRIGAACADKKWGALLRA